MDVTEDKGEAKEKRKWGRKKEDVYGSGVKEVKVEKNKEKGEREKSSEGKWSSREERRKNFERERGCAFTLETDKKGISIVQGSGTKLKDIPNGKSSFDPKSKFHQLFSIYISHSPFSQIAVDFCFARMILCEVEQEVSESDRSGQRNRRLLLEKLGCHFSIELVVNLRKWNTFDGCTWLLLEKLQCHFSIELILNLRKLPFENKSDNSVAIIWRDEGFDDLPVNFLSVKELCEEVMTVANALDMLFNKGDAIAMDINTWPSFFQAELLYQ
ncbi:Acetyl-coenzyme A synthetase [Carex littledalei]|uniref:Acetyl-coenzyme A synthetase n=1 Tax=Carex littledalei TaxID=544730 RepID=A0A833QW71_9POAL|nr:Acetyl-coenzyme A synthetase [Carex littledalei]